MSKKEISKRKKWQEEVYKRLKQNKEKKEIKILNKKIIYLPGIFAPLWGDSILLAKVIKKQIKKGEEVLDLGTGSGIQGLFAAEKAKKVLSVDINKKAIECAKINSIKNNLSKKIETKKGYLFSNINKKFDTIIFNPPFRWFNPRDLLEKGEVDKRYKTLRKFFKKVKKYLKENGRIILVFSNSGDINYLKFLIEKNKFNYKILKKERINAWDYFVYEIKKRPKVKIRKANLKDLNNLMEVEKRSYPPQLQTTKEILEFRMKKFGIWLAEKNKEIVGFFTCVPINLNYEKLNIKRIIKNRKPDYKPWFEEYTSKKKYNTLWITSTAVKSNYQKQGIGTELLKYSLYLTKNLGLKYRTSAPRCQYKKYYDKTNKNIKEYIKEMEKGKIKDRFLNLYLNLGFKLLSPLSNYEPFKGSKNYNILTYKKLK